jgi:hypothetical protein
VAIATYGSPAWANLARNRAMVSALGLGVPAVHYHGIDLQEARNRVLARVETEWVIHLDGDDELEPGFLEAMQRASADVRAPAVRYIQPIGRPTRPRMPRVSGHTHDCNADCLTQGNWLVVGACARTDLLRRVGGWGAEPVYEDWALWLRCHLAGATFEAVPDAIYRAHVRRNSRNRAPSRAVKLATHRAIEAANGLLPGGERAT